MLNFIFKDSRKIQPNWWEVSYLVIFAIILIFTMWGTTMLPDFWPSRFGLFTYFLIMVYVIVKGIKKFTYTKKETVFALIIGTSFLICAFKNDMYSFLFMLAFLIVGAKDVSIDKILKVYLLIDSIIMLIAFVCSQLGMIENLQYWKNEQMRFALGSVYPTDFAAHIFYIVLVAICLYNRKVYIVETLIIGMIAIVVYKWTIAYTSLICIIGYAAFLFIYIVYIRKRMIHNDSVFIKAVSTVPVILAGLFISMTVMYDANNQKWFWINEKLSDRLENSKKGFEINGFNLFGKYIEEIGWGKRVIERPDYFFLDDSYIRILLEYGIIVFIVVLIILIVISRRAAKAGRITMVFAVAFIALHSFMEHHLMDVAYNPFILCVFANLNLDKEKKKCMTLNKH